MRQTLINTVDIFGYRQRHKFYHLLSGTLIVSLMLPNTCNKRNGQTIEDVFHDSGIQYLIMVVTWNVNVTRDYFVMS